MVYEEFRKLASAAGLDMGREESLGFGTSSLSFFRSVWALHTILINEQKEQSNGGFF
jgi:hypothetical protein